MTHLIPVLRLMTDALRRRLSPSEEPPAFDPIDHPMLRRMSPLELADLPFPRPAPREGAEDALGAREPQPQEPDDVPHAA